MKLPGLSAIIKSIVLTFIVFCGIVTILAGLLYWLLERFG